MILLDIAPTPIPHPIANHADAPGMALARPDGAGDGADSASGDRASDQDDIVVTARRHSESVQDVPIAISVLGGDTLARTGTANVSRLTQLQPSIQFYSSNPRNSAANIRGLGAPFGLTNDGIEQGVGIYIDQVYYSRIASATFDFLDVERVEVLRGPQGTLYGKNTTAGAISITTRQPTFEPEVRAEITIGNLGYVQAKAAVSGPLVADTLAIRLAGSRAHRRGTIFNTATGTWVNEQDNLGLRAQLLWRAAPDLEVTLAADYNAQNPECCAQIYVRTGATQRPLSRQYAALAAAFGYAPPSLNPFDRLTDLDTDLRAKQSIGGVSLRAEWDVGAGTLTSVSAWRFWHWDPSNDRDFTGLPITTVSANPSDQQQWTQEIRYASKDGGSLQYTLGAFLFHQTLDTSGSQVQGAAASRWLLNPSSASASNPAVLDGLRSDNDIGFENTSLAFFGKLNWTLGGRWHVQPGLRVNYDRKLGHYLATVTNGTGTPLTSDQRGVLAPQSYSARFAAWNVSGDFTLSYDFGKDALGYATYARSFKSGGINLSGLPLDAAGNPIQAAASVRPEKVDHVELGLKSRWLDRQLTFNLAAYWTDIHDYQATVMNGQIGVLRGYLANAGRVRVRGVEADLSARPNDRLSLYINGAYTDARYIRFRDAPCPPELSGGAAADATHLASAPGTPGGYSPASCDISGQWLPGVSRWAFSYGADYQLPARLLSKDGHVHLGVDASSRSRFSSNPSRSAYTDIGGYTLVNFRAGYRTDDGWDLFGWVRNAFDARYFEMLATQSGNTGLVVGQPGDPRTYGFTLSRAF